MGQKILVAFDDSENAMRAVDYIASSFSKEHEITLYSIIPDTAAICDMNSPSLIPYFQERQASFCAIEDQKKELVEEALQKAKGHLVSAGFDENNITVKVQTKNKGVVRDIVNEANTGYDTIVVGRKGHSGVKEFILGNVSQKILQLARDMSVIVVD
ncbi:MAG: universal stress protein [Deltaproteobacteria bacterium]|nr:universal stress protein [Deltaproteobacteria bacterium]